LFAGSGKYNNYVTEAGYGIVDVQGFDPEMVMDCSRKFNFSWLNKKDIERVFLSQVEIIQHYKPDLVIGDMSPTLKMAAEKQGVKYIALMNGYMTRYYAETRMLSRTHAGYTYLKKLPAHVADKVVKIAENIAFKIVHRPFRQLRRAYKLKPVASYLLEMEGDENLICDEEAIFPQTNLPGNYKIIGPLLYTTQTDESVLLDSLKSSKPTICVCMGSSGDWSALGFLSKPKYKHLNIVTAGDHEEVIKGDHVIRTDFVNLDQLLPRCAYLICHGGNGTIYKGLEHNIYMLCFTSHFEQEWNVQMLEKLSLGRSINDAPEKILNSYLNSIYITSNK
jgi:UDP:flavonoid glycosyltransferase YjiC (YdhE family)